MKPSSEDDKVPQPPEKEELSGKPMATSGGDSLIIDEHCILDEFVASVLHAFGVNEPLQWTQILMAVGVVLLPPLLLRLLWPLVLFLLAAVAVLVLAVFVVVAMLPFLLMKFLLQPLLLALKQMALSLLLLMILPGLTAWLTDVLDGFWSSYTPTPKKKKGSSPRGRVFEAAREEPRHRRGQKSLRPPPGEHSFGAANLIVHENAEPAVCTTTGVHVRGPMTVANRDAWTLTLEWPQHSERPVCAAIIHLDQLAPELQAVVSRVIDIAVVLAVGEVDVETARDMVRKLAGATEELRLRARMMRAAGNPHCSCNNALVDLTWTLIEVELRVVSEHLVTHPPRYIPQRT